ncbi:MAG: flagellar motor protein MotB [Elusimicrobiota bacterium]
MNRKDVNNLASQSYQLPYISLMTVLCIYFISLYVYFNKLAAKNTKQKSEITQEIFDEIEEISKDVANVEITQDKIKITLPSDIVFNLGDSSIKKELEPVLKKLAKTFKLLPEEYLIIFEGHTDNSPVWYGGNFFSNWELSAYRALSLQYFFVDEGIKPEKMRIVGYGEFKLLFQNDTEEHKTANRRVEIILKKRGK